jgi:hypothetical protein
MSCRKALQQERPGLMKESYIQAKVMKKESLMQKK